MVQASKRRKRDSGPRAVVNLLVLLLLIAGILGALYFLFPALTSGDLFWYSTDFDARPIKLEIVDGERRETISPDDPRFLPLVDAFNGSIERGYRLSSSGVSAATWERIGEHGVMVEATYAQPVALHLRGGFAPTERLMILFSDGDLHLDSVLFRDHGQQNGAIPVQLEDAAPLREALSRDGYMLN